MDSNENTNLATERGSDAVTVSPVAILRKGRSAHSRPLRSMEENERNSVNTIPSRDALFRDNSNGRPLINPSTKQGLHAHSRSACISGGHSRRLSTYPPLKRRISSANPRPPVSTQSLHTGNERSFYHKPNQYHSSTGRRRTSVDADNILTDEPPRGCDSSLQWSFISEMKSSTAGKSIRSGSESSTTGTLKRIAKESKEYVTNYLHPRGIRINQNIKRGELSHFREHLESPTEDDLQSCLGNFYVDNDDARIERLTQFALDYADTNQKETQWNIEVYLPGFLGGSQRPPSYLKDGSIERRAEEFMFSPAVDTKAVRPPPVLQDGNHSVPVAEFPPEKIPGQGGYFLDWMFATRDRTLGSKIKKEPAIRTNADRRLFPAYAIGEVKADPSFLQGAVSYAAWISGSLLHERLRFRGRYEDERIEYKEDDAIYAILPAGREVQLYKMHVRLPEAHENPATETGDGQHIRCEFKLLDSLDLALPNECKILFSWINLIHYYGMTKHRIGVEMDIMRYNECKVDGREIDQLGNATFRYAAEHGICIMRCPGHASISSTVSDKVRGLSSRSATSSQLPNLQTLPIRQQSTLQEDTPSKVQGTSRKPTGTSSRPLPMAKTSRLASGTLRAESSKGQMKDARGKAKDEDPR
jgi:hypothetical protein